MGLDDGERSEIEEILKRANENWMPVLRIQRVYNEVLEAMFLERREAMRRLGKTDEQVLVFHGTQPQNIVPYRPFDGNVNVEDYGGRIQSWRGGWSSRYAWKLARTFPYLIWVLIVGPWSLHWNRT